MVKHYELLCHLLWTDRLAGYLIVVYFKVMKLEDSLMLVKKGKVGMGSVVKGDLNSAYSAFTLMETLLVMIIMVVLMAMGLVYIPQMKGAMAKNTAVSTISQDLRWAQRAAMFLDRDVGEGWIYGIGIDFSNIENTGQYTIFKWCAPFSDYDPNGDVRMRGELPGFDPSYNLGIAISGAKNGYLPVSGGAINAGTCSSATARNELLKVEQLTGESVLQSEALDLSLSASGIVMPAYVLFESTTGRAFLYDGASTHKGRIINYTYTTGDSEVQYSANPIPLGVKIARKGQSIGTIVYVTPVSGRVTVENEVAL